MVLRELLRRLCAAELPAHVKPGDLLRKAHAGSCLLACRRRGCLAAQRLLSQRGAASGGGCMRQAGRPAMQSSMYAINSACIITAARPHIRLLACLRGNRMAM